ncbi:MAG: nuclear transport factor 2 family protein [Opitutus sp.]
MKQTLWVCLLLLGWSNAIYAAEKEDFAAVKLADEQRIAATIARNTSELAKLLSDELYYGNSDGRVQTKSQLLVAAGGTKFRYGAPVPVDSGFQMVAPGFVAMNGTARFSATANDKKVEFTIRFLALWRKEGAQWQLLSYQSTQIPTG